MVQLVAKPFTPSSLTLLPSFLSASLLFLSWEEVAASVNSINSLPLPTRPGRGTELESTQISPGALGDLGLYSQGSAGVGDYQQADNVSTK